MFLFLTLSNFLYLIICQVIFFKLLNLKNSWFLITLICYLIIIFIFLPDSFDILNKLEYLFFNLLILTCYLFFLTGVFNGSPSIFLLNNPNKKNFIKQGFVKHRLNLMKKDKLVTNKNKILPRGRKILLLANLLSNIVFKDND